MCLQNIKDTQDRYSDTLIYLTLRTVQIWGRLICFKEPKLSPIHTHWFLKHCYTVPEREWVHIEEWWHVADTKGNILSTVLQCNVDSFSRDVGATDIQGNIICDLARMWTYIAEQCYVALIQGNILCNIELYRLIQPSCGCLMREQLEPKKHERLWPNVIPALWWAQTKTVCTPYTLYY